MARSIAFAFVAGILAGHELRIWAKNRTYGAVIVAELRSDGQTLARLECSSRRDADGQCQLARQAREGDEESAHELALDMLELAR